MLMIVVSVLSILTTVSAGGQPFSYSTLTPGASVVFNSGGARPLRVVPALGHSANGVSPAINAPIPINDAAPIRQIVVVASPAYISPPIVPVNDVAAIRIPIVVASRPVYASPVISSMDSAPLRKVVVAAGPAYGSYSSGPIPIRQVGVYANYAGSIGQNSLVTGLRYL